MLALKREEAARTPGARVASRGFLEKDNEVDSPLSLQEGTQPCRSLAFSPLRPITNSWPPVRKIIS